MFNVLAIEGNHQTYEILPWCLDLSRKEISVSYDLINAFDTIEDEDIKLVVIGDEIHYIPLLTLEDVIDFTEEEKEKVKRLKNEYMPLGVKEFITTIRSKKNLPIPKFCIYTTGFYYPYENSREEIINDKFNQELLKRLKEENISLFIKSVDNENLKRYIKKY